MASCNWQQDLDAHARNVLLFRCSVCGSWIELCQRVIDERYGGSIDAVLDKQPPCGTRHLKHMPGIHKILADGPDKLNATLDRIQASGEKMPPIARRIGNYAKEIARWKAAGSPIWSAEEVLRRFTSLCSPCPHFNAKKSTCNLCGCRVRSSGKAFLNKLAMGTTRCPAPKPLWVEMPGYEQSKEETA